MRQASPYVGATRLRNVSAKVQTAMKWIRRPENLAYRLLKKNLKLKDNNTHVFSETQQYLLFNLLVPRSGH
jgi:hypothetical protein